MNGNNSESKLPDVPEIPIFLETVSVKEDINLFGVLVLLFGLGLPILMIVDLFFRIYSK